MTPETAEPYLPNQITCYQCGAPLPVQVGSQFVTCEFCGATNFVDKSGAVLHYAVAPTIDQATATAALRRWMGGNDTVKELDKKATITSVEYQLVPMWLVRVQDTGAERVLLEPAAATSALEMTDMSIPAASLQPYDHELDGQAVAPTVPYTAVQKWLAANHNIQPNQIQEASLVHLPIYFFHYEFEGQNYHASVDAATSKVFPGIFPSKWETPYMAIGSAGCLAYFCAAFAPLIGYLLFDGEGIVLGTFFYCIFAVIIAIPIFIVARTIAAKV
jgi:hypothetical protein